MSEKIIVGPITKGLRNGVTPFVIDNDSFPVLINAYQWRGRIKRKRGTSLLGRLQRAFDTQSIGTITSGVPFNLYTSLTPPVIAEINAAIVPGSVQIFINPSTVTGNFNAPGYTNASDCEVFSTGSNIQTGTQISISGVVVVPGTGPNLINGGPYFVEGQPSIPSGNSFKLGLNSGSWGTWQSGGTWSFITGAIILTDQGNGTLTSTTPGNSGVINYVTGNVTLTTTAGPGTAADATFRYYPNLPVMGLEEVRLESNDYPGTMAFDTTYSYLIDTIQPYEIHDIDLYKNPPLTTAFTGYVPKTTDTAFFWNGKDYQQFWTVNYQGALWATNGVTVPFNPTNIGMQFAPAASITYVSNTATTLTVVITNSPLVIGDFVFINEWLGVNNITLNFQSGYVTAATGTPASLTVTITFPNVAFGVGPYTPGIIQYLTNTATPTKDGIRWYDGDPTVSNNGWVNFAPPLSRQIFSISDHPARQYYLVGAKMIIPFKDRLLFIGPVIQTSSIGSQLYLEDTVIYSQNGTPYYTSSFTGDPSLTTTVFNPILVPINQIANAPAWWEDQTGFGGFIPAGVDQPINTCSSAGDVLILGFTNLQTKLVYTGDDLIPFLFYSINSELGSSSTFSSIDMDRACLSRGDRGFVVCTETNTERIDLDIPDEVFELKLLDNGSERVCAQRDFINEWIYFTYPVNEYEEDSFDYKFPNQTLQYNYRDNSWAIFRECYTTYGQFKKRTGYTWATIGFEYPTWRSWNEPWDSGADTLLEPKVIAGNQQGFVIERDVGTNEATSLYISAITGNVVTSPDHTLNVDDYITISGVTGSVASQVNGLIFSVADVRDANTFTLNPPISGGTYTGAGLITRMYVPFIQTKQFPVGWSVARKTRLGPQQYLLEGTSNSQITLLIYLSQDADNAWNASPIIPAPNTVNGSLVYSTILYTCPESTNLGLTPANINLNMVTAQSQRQIWHRVNTSLIGDTIQLGFTMSDTQMRDVNFTNQFAEIILHSFILDCSPSMNLA
jgi:hypothetical protein